MEYHRLFPSRPPREKRRRDFPPSDFWRSLRPPFATLAITVVVSLSLCFSRATTLPESREPRPFQPPASIHRPKLESNFPHHIPQKLLRGARLGGKQRDARLSPCARRNDEMFLPPLCLFLPPPLHSSCPPSLSFSRVARSKTISEHIARVRLRSPFPVRLLAMSSRLFDPRGRRNNACTSPLSFVVPLVVVLAAQPPLLAFRCAKDFLTGEKLPRERIVRQAGRQASRCIGVRSRKISGYLTH